MSMINDESPGVHVVRAGEGPATWVVGDTYTFKATAESTGGAFALVEASIPPGSGPPPHLHTREDEAFYLLDGELQVTAAGRTTLLRGGDFMYLPRGIVHSFINPSVAAARALIVITPGGFEKFFEEVGTPARAGAQAPPFDPADIARFAETAQRYGNELMAPTGTPVG
ncbi:MAG TPA: quercetin 2,3-dioxygenase [Pseudonocardia sp.]|nr:quercetin 2,3-dioxygenase [Pseudonocardia sp.]